jgi:hypothetical protein
MLPTVSALSSYVQVGSGKGYLLGGGQRREVLDAASAAAAGISLPAWSGIKAATLTGVPYGAPIVRTGVVVGHTGTSDDVYLTPTASYVISSAVRSQTKIMTWLGGTVGSLDTGSLNRLPGSVSFPRIFKDASTSKVYLLAAAGKSKVSDPSEWNSKIPVAEASIISKIPSTSKNYKAPRFVESAQSKTVYLIANGKRHKVAAADRKKIAKAEGISSAVSLLPSVTVGVVGNSAGGQVVAPATVISTSKKGTKWFVDGYGVRRKISASVEKELLGTTSTRVVSKAILAGYSAKPTSVKLGIACGTTRLIADGGVIRRISVANAKKYGKAFGFFQYDHATCVALLKRKGTSLGTLIKYSGTYYSVSGGNKKAVSTATYKKLAKSRHTKAQVVSKYFAARL